MVDFNDWFNGDDFDLINFPDEAMEAAYQAGFQAGQADQREKDVAIAENHYDEKWSDHYRRAGNGIAKAIREAE